MDSNAALPRISRCHGNETGSGCPGDRKSILELLGRTVMVKKKVGIVGKWFLAFNQDGRLDLQGRVLEKMKNGIYLIETYSWNDGQVLDERIIPVDQMSNWRLYPDFETFGLRAQQYLKSEPGPN
jgi:hypothetical protein